MKDITILKLIIISIIVIFSVLGIKSVAFHENGVINGSVSIGPLCPVEPCSIKTDVYSLRKVVLEPQFGNLIYLNISSDGKFNATVPSGTYSINLTDCTYLGCKYSLPKIIVIEPNKTTAIEIYIDTGIR